MVQLNEVATHVKSRIETVITRIKSQEINDPSTDSSSSPKATNPESLNHQTARVVDAVFNTLFGACNGASCNSTKDDCQLVSETFKKKNILTKEQRAQLQTLKTAGSNLESRYAQHYQDDHGRAARAVLMASEREEKEKMSRRKHWQMMNRQAKADAMNTTIQERRNRRNLGAMQVPQHQERMKVNGNPLSLAEVNQSFEERSEGGISYNFDDGISALSAHTLEEMARTETMLQRKSRAEKEPQEQGFNVSIEKKNASNPPSPVGTDESSRSLDDGQDRHEYPLDEIREIKALPQGQKYPVQMARNQSNTDSFLSNSMQTSGSEYTETWKQRHDTRHEQRFWTQVGLENDNQTKESSQNHDNINESLIQRKQRKKKRRPTIFGRRKGKKYMECEESDDEEYDI